MDQDSNDVMDDSAYIPPAPSPPKLSATDVYKSNNRNRRSPTPDRRRRWRSGSRSRSPPSRSSRRSRSRDRDREYPKDNDYPRDKDREREKDRDRYDRDRDREYSKERDRSKKRSRRSRSRSNSRSRSRNRRGRDRQDRNYNRNKYNKNQNSNHAGGYGGSSFMPAVAQPIIPVQSNAFKNDGSFMEMFKKMQEQIPQPEPPSVPTVLEEKPVAPPPLMVGKRRGGRILKTGVVVKPKTEQQIEQPKDAWSLYMAEVKKYREVCCQEEDNTRPLVK
ncbi:pre-mRNA-splicing factor CWC25 isoform X1 [Copidosoma floridanum]|uniref:pre-mRNA-splicing factor CWC25 isoform X1 n=1 Tax=Copidosoma floridanum TaxID=29053 RepID=UPI0006C9D1EB|nr:pre-mRNA-splicing factor CWC25 isoform X1 [Copidosoma floridanum]